MKRLFYHRDSEVSNLCETPVFNYYLEVNGVFKSSMQIIQFMYIFIAGVNILTLCYAEQKGSLFMNHIFNQNGPNLRIGVPNPDILNSPVTLPPIKQEKPLVVVINGLVKNLNKTNNNNSIENVTSEKTFVETSNDNVTSVNNKTSGAVQHIKYPGEDDTGALKRGSLVFLGLCVIVLACYAWKTYR